MGKKSFFSWAVVVVLLGCNTEKVNDGAGGTVAKQEDLLAGIVTSVPPDTPETLALKKGKLENNLALAKEVAAKGDFDQAITLLEDSLVLDPNHREVLALLISTSSARAREMHSEDPGRFYRLIVQAGGYIQTLKDAYKDLTNVEREMIANVSFDEACAHARSKRQTEFTSAFNAAMDAGFADLALLESEPDLEEFRKIPEMDSIIRNAIEAITKRSQKP